MSPAGRQMHTTRGTELARLLLRTFDAMVREVEDELDRRGHAGFTAANEFALRAIEAGADSAAELGRRLGVSRQAAAKSIAALERLGYVERCADPADARRKLLQVTTRGYEADALGAQLFDELRQRWSATLGHDRLAALEDALGSIATIVADPREPAGS